MAQDIYALLAALGLDPRVLQNITPRVPAYQIRQRMQQANPPATKGLGVTPIDLIGPSSLGPQYGGPIAGNGPYYTGPSSLPQITGSATPKPMGGIAMLPAAQYGGSIHGGSASDQKWLAAPAIGNTNPWGAQANAGSGFKPTLGSFLGQNTKMAAPAPKKASSSPYMGVY